MPEVLTYLVLGGGGGLTSIVFKSPCEIITESENMQKGLLTRNGSS